MAQLISQRSATEAEKRSRAKSTKKGEKRYEATFLQVEKRVDEFKKKNPLNIYTKAQLGSAFKYTLLDNGLDQEFADKTTTWLLLKFK